MERESEGDGDRTGRDGNGSPRHCCSLARGQALGPLAMYGVRSRGWGRDSQGGSRSNPPQPTRRLEKRQRTCLTRTGWHRSCVNDPTDLPDSTKRISPRAILVATPIFFFLSILLFFFCSPPHKSSCYYRPALYARSTHMSATRAKLHGKCTC